MELPENTPLARLNSLWLRWTEPHSSLTVSADRVRAQALTSVLLFMFIMGVAFEVVGYLLGVNTVDYLVLEISIVLIVGAMTIFSRGRYYRVVAMLIALVIAFGSFLLTIASAYQTSLIFISLSYFVVATALPTSRALFIGILNIILALTAPLFVAEWSSFDDISIELTFIVVSTIIVYALTFIQRYYITLNEEKTIELETANQLLEEKIKHLETVQLLNKQSEQNFKKMFYSSPDPIVIVRLRDGKYLDFNWSFLDATGYTADELKNVQGQELFATDDTATRYIKQLRSEKHIFSEEFDIKTKTGDILTTLISSELIEWDGETCIVCMARDITAHKRAQHNELKVMQEQERSTLLQKFITDASHDFRTPLATIGTSVYLINKSQDETRRQHHLKVIEQQTNHIEKLVDGLIMMSMLDSNSVDFQFFATDLNQLIESIVHQYPNSEDIPIQLDLDPNVPYIPLDIHYLQIAIKQLLDNALRFTPADGLITIATSYHHMQDCIQLDIKDTGVGMDEETLQHSFERLYRGDSARNQKTGGAGLGLSITRQIIHHHQGTIQLSSKPDEGSYFQITLPVRNPVATPEIQ